MLKACSIVPNEQPGYKASSKMAHSTLKVKTFSENVPFLQMSPVHSARSIVAHHKFYKLE